MEAFLFFGLLIVAFVAILVGFGCLLYFVPKRFGYPRIGTYLTITFGLLVATVVLSDVFRDQLFTKNNAKELIEEQQILLLNKFDLKENKSMSGIGDYYHTFTLKISEQDKQNAILKIKSAKNFESQNGSIETLLYKEKERYFGPKVIQNYEAPNEYIREYFQPSGQEGYAPTFRRILISKTKNELTFEDIDE